MFGAKHASEVLENLGLFLNNSRRSHAALARGATVRSAKASHRACGPAAAWSSRTRARGAVTRLTTDWKTLGQPRESAHWRLRSTCRRGLGWSWNAGGCIHHHRADHANGRRAAHTTRSANETTTFGL